jgi:hypothetical protein
MSVQLEIIGQTFNMTTHFSLSCVKTWRFIKQRTPLTFITFIKLFIAPTLTRIFGYNKLSYNHGTRCKKISK